MRFHWIAIVLLTIVSFSPQLEAGPPPEETIRGEVVSAEKNPTQLYEQALAHAGKAEYDPAVTLLDQARDLFSAEKNSEGAYKSAALAFFLRDEAASLKQHRGQPAWFRSSWLLADFLYSAQFVIPPVKSPSGPYPFGGLLILAREVRRVDLPSGGSIAVWGVLDVQVVPPLQPGEAFAPDPGPCRLVGAPAGGGSASGGNEADAGLAALVMVKGHENDAVWKDVRKAWRFNHRTSRIEEMPASQVFCQNETLGL